ncbi:hypothetical protein Tco_1089941 [Tanacetum coccineum]|uniref:Uncharacterized protein n=1 Tax=Tanacetum coccineum TaxID=301880 RepID=A0ABQ5I2Y7_9ASTR
MISMMLRLVFPPWRGVTIEGSSKRAGDEKEQEVTKKKKIDDDQEATEMKELMEIVLDEEEVTIDAIHLATKPPSIGRIVGIKSLLKVTAVKLMLLVSKLLLLVFRVNAAGTKLQLLKDKDCLKIKITYCGDMTWKKFKGNLKLKGIFCFIHRSDLKMYKDVQVLKLKTKLTEDQATMDHLGISVCFVIIK